MSIISESVNQMARIQLVLPDDDRDRFVHAARTEGVSLSEWLRLAAKERIHRHVDRQPFRDAADVSAFFERCDADSGDEGIEPDWEEHLGTMRRSRGEGAAET